MKEPEELALIGGGILLSSTLVFTLRSQASNILPHVGKSMSALLPSGQSNDDHNSSNDRPNNLQRQQDDFAQRYQQAQKNGWTTDHWGTAPFYIDDQGNMHVGSGKLQKPLGEVTTPSQLHTLSLDLPVQAPENGDWLFADDMAMYNQATQYYHLDNLDTSQTTSMSSMFYGDSHITSLDISKWDTSNVTDVNGMFQGDTALSSVHLSGINTSKVNNMERMLSDDSNLSSLDLSSFNIGNDVNTTDMMANDGNVSTLTLGPQTKFPKQTGLGYIYENWHNNGSTLTMEKINDGQAHPGTWLEGSMAD